MNEEFIKLAAFILAGALSGGLTNTVAIWMLFHPYEPPKLLRRWRLGFLQGAIPKNQPRLAAAIGKTVGDRLLTAEDLTQTFTDETFRATFDDRLAQFLNGVLNMERAALRDLIPERVMPDIEVLLEEGMPPEVWEGLVARGHAVVDWPGDVNPGIVQLIQIDQQSGAMTGASDPRGDGRAVGL